MLRHGLLLCALYTLLVTSVASLQSRTVTIDQGPVRGYIAPEGGVFVFYGIPYATAPTGTQRFRPPLPPPSWIETFEAVETNIICPQNLAHRNYKGEFKMQEDCLVANVYVPDTEEKNLPVVVYVHGGAFQFGFSTTRTPIHLVQTKKLILVNFNYRLGAHGFLCLGTKDVPGNAGMKDQVALLRWVKKNIAQFGGNPNDVTINGCSAGGNSVDLFIMSKMTTGLFQKVIPESGSNTASFLVQTDPIGNAKKVLKMSNVTIEDLNELENFYKTAPYEKLYENNLSNEKDSSTIFSPCLERDIGEEMFLDDHPDNIIKKGDYPMLPTLYGITEMEGIYRLPNFDTWKDLMNENFTDFIPENLQFASDEERNEIALKIKQFYFGNESISENEESVLNFVRYFTDVMFGYGVAKNVKMQVEAGNSQIYLYEYSFADKSVDNMPYTNKRGATHCAQAHAVMDSEDESNLSQEYKNMKLVLRELWVNFITTGKPVPDDSKYPAWPPVGHDRSPYMSLNSTLELRTRFLGNRALFWDDIYETYIRFPIKP